MSGERWCHDCQEKTKKILPPICDLCGQTIKTNNLCQRCYKSPRYFKAARFWAEFGGPVRNALHDIKYRKNIGLGLSLAQNLVSLIRQNNWNIDLVIPVPLGERRAKQRGNNQAALIAKPLASYLQLPYNPRTLQRYRETISQVELSLAERQNNVKDAFQTNRKSVDGLSILIIDDVMTSGSTLNACAKSLIESGAQAVFGLTVARAVLNGPS